MSRTVERTLEGPRAGIKLYIYIYIYIYIYRAYCSTLYIYINYIVQMDTTGIFETEHWLNESISSIL